MRLNYSVRCLDDKDRPIVELHHHSYSPLELSSHVTKYLRELVREDMGITRVTIQIDIGEEQ